MENYRDAFRQYVYRRLSQYKDWGTSVEDTTMQKYNAYVNIRAVIALRLAPENHIRTRGNCRMDKSAYEKYCQIVDEILPPRNQDDAVKQDE